MVQYINSMLLINIEVMKHRKSSKYTWNKKENNYRVCSYKRPSKVTKLYKEDILKKENLYIGSDNEVYEYPCIILYYPSESHSIHYFKTYDQAKLVAEQIVGTEGFFDADILKGI